jgi:hypothetical protein
MPGRYDDRVVKAVDLAPTRGHPESGIPEDASSCSISESENDRPWMSRKLTHESRPASCDCSVCRWSSLLWRATP